MLGCSGARRRCPPPCRGFKALKQIVKLHYKMGKYDKMIQAYT